MKRFTIAICSLAFIFSACKDTKTDSSVTTDSKDSSSTVAKSAPTYDTSNAAMEKAWMAYATPGPMHQLMASSNGTWTGEATMWMSPDSLPTKSTIKTVNKSIYNGLYQESVNTGSFMNQPFEGKSIMGYDNTKKKFFSTWVDNMGSGIMMMEGTYDSTSKTFNFIGQGTNFMDGSDCTIKETFQIVDDNTHVMKMWGPDFKTGKEFQTMEIRMTRNK